MATQLSRGIILPHKDKEGHLWLVRSPFYHEDAAFYSYGGASFFLETLEGTEEMRSKRTGTPMQPVRTIYKEV